MSGPVTQESTLTPLEIAAALEKASSFEAAIDASNASVVAPSDTKLISFGNGKSKLIKDKGSCLKQVAEDSKPKQKSRRILIPFYSTFNFGNRCSKSPDKDKKRKLKCDSKAANSDHEEQVEKRDEQKEDEEEEEKDELKLDIKRKSVYNIAESPKMYINNKLYSEIDYRANEIEDDIQNEFVVKKEIKSPKLYNKAGSDSKKYSLVKARIAKYQKHMQKEHCSSPDAAPFCKEVVNSKRYKTLEHSPKTSATKSKYATLEAVRSKFQSQVTNFSYEGVDFPASSPLQDQEYDQQELYDELKLVYDGDEIYAVRECNGEGIHSSETETYVQRPHLSIDSITLISNKNMRASLNISVSGNRERLSSALPDTRWKDAGKFSRRSLRKSSYKKKEAKKMKSSSENTSNTASPPNELDVDSPTNFYTGSLTNLRTDSPDLSCDSFPEYAKVNKKKNSSTETLAGVESQFLDYRKMAFKGCSDKGPVAKKIGQFAMRNRREADHNTAACPVKKTESFKGTKVGRKRSFTCNSRPKIVKRPITAPPQHEQDNGDLVKTQGVKLRRRESRNGRKGEYRLSVTIQPSTVANLTDKFNSLISQNQTITESGRSQTQIPLGKISVTDGKLGRVYHSPRASFKRKYRTRSHKNRKSVKKDCSSTENISNDLSDGNKEHISISSASRDSQQILSKRTVENRGPRIVNIKKVPSIGRAPGDNKTDEEKVCDKIETALSSGKFKGETDESDVEQDDAVEDRQSTEDKNSVFVDDDLCDNEKKCLSSVTGETSPVSTELTEQNSECVSLSIKQSTEFPTVNETASAEVIDSEEPPEVVSSKSESLLMVNALDATSFSHQKSESIDSGILSDDNTLNLMHKIPETVEEDLTYGVVGAIDHCSLLTCQSDDSGIDQKSGPEANIDTCILYERDTISTQKEETDEEPRRDASLLLERRPVIDGISNDFKICNDDEISANNKREPIIKTELDVNTECHLPFGSEVYFSESENKTYSSVIRAVVKNTVRRTKEKDYLKKEAGKENKAQEKESWFKRSRSRERTDDKENNKVSDCDVCHNKDSHCECDKNKESGVEIEAKNDVQANGVEAVMKQKKERNSKIYESWIFKKIREKSQERKISKELTPVEVVLDEGNDQNKNNTCCNAANHTLEDESDESNINKIVNKDGDSLSKDQKEKEDGYGLFLFKARGRNKEKKKTKTTADRVGNSQKLTNEMSSNCTEESISSSPASSVRTQHSRKLSDTSVCTIESEAIYGKTSISKLKSSNSQRSTSSIPPPPKTPIPSPPKSARIVVKIDEDDLKDDDYDDRGTIAEKGSSENIYEHLYSPDIDKLKENRAKLEERGIIPNPSFLWTDGNAPNMLTVAAKLPLTRTRTPERQQPFSKITGIKSFGRPEKTRRDASLPRMDHSSDDGHNYSELNQISSDDSHTTAAYDEIGGLSAVSYDDIRMSSSCSYDDVRAPSSVGYDSLKAPSSNGGYDPVNPPPARSDSSQYDECDGVLVTAQVAVVKEDQLDSISYLYDDITYNVSQTSHSYEPVNPPGTCSLVVGGQHYPPPLAITSIKEVPEPETTPPPVQESCDAEGEAEDEAGVHEVFSYKLTRVGGVPSVITAGDAFLGTSEETDFQTDDGKNSDIDTVVETCSSPSSPINPASKISLQESVYGKEAFCSDADPTSSIGLRDSLRSSVSSYHTAYSAKYFTRSKMESVKTREEEKCSVIQDSKSKKTSKTSDDYKESKFSFMGRKFRELGKFGRGKGGDKENAKKNEKCAEKSTDQAKKSEKEVNCENEKTKCSNISNQSNANESSELILSPTNANTSKNPDVSEDSTKINNKKKRNPNLKLSDCPPLHDDFTSDIINKPVSIPEIYGHAEGKHVSSVLNNATQTTVEEGEQPDEWEDMEDVADQQEQSVSGPVPRQLVRVPVRSRRSSAHPRVWRKTWSQGVRDAHRQAAAPNLNGSNKHRRSNRLQPPSRCSENSSVYGDRYYGSCSDLQLAEYATESSAVSNYNYAMSIHNQRLEHDAMDAVIGEDTVYGSASSALRGKLRSKKQKYRLQENVRLAGEGRYRKRFPALPTQSLHHRSNLFTMTLLALHDAHPNGGATVMLRRPSHASSFCSSASHYSTSSFTSSSSSSSSSSTPDSSFSAYFSAVGDDCSPTLSESPGGGWQTSGESSSGREDLEVYISSSSTILLGPSLLDDDASNTYDEAYDRSYYNASQLSAASSSLHYDSVRIRSIFFDGTVNEAQEISCFVDEDADSDGDGDAASHYEAIYEAINDLQQHVLPGTDYSVGHEDDPKGDCDDSFDSDDSDEAYSRLQPQLRPGDTSSLFSGLHRQESQGSADLCPTDVSPYQRQGSVGSSASGSQSMTRIAEAANLGMRRLRRNWSQTKTEVKTGLNKIKKKGTTASMFEGKSIENIYADASPSNEEKRKWSFKNHFVRRKSTSSLVTPSHAPLSLSPVDKEKETATFYLTLTIETDKRDADLAAAAAEASQRLKGMDLIKNLELLKEVDGKNLSVIELARISDVDVVERPKSCLGVPGDASLRGRGSCKADQRRSSNPRPTRPKNAPPAPPSDYSESEDGRYPESEDLSKDKLAIRLNQLLSAGPASHRGRRVLHSSHCSSSDSSPVPQLVPPDLSPTTTTAPTLPQHATALSAAQAAHSLRNLSPTSKRSTLPNSGRSCVTSSLNYNQLNIEDNNARLSAEIASCITRNVPNNRSSVVSSSSHGSSEGYIRPSDIANIPPPLPARPSGQQRPKKQSDDASAPNSTPATPIQTTIPEDLPDADCRAYLEFNCDSPQVQQEEPTYMSSHFADEPLYQFYAASVLERATCRQGEYSSEDDYEVINDGSGIHGTAAAAAAAAAAPRPTAMEIVTPTDGRRTLWCELQEVVNSGILITLTSCQRKVQEAMFEVITSEASYLKSLEVLITHFFSCPAFASETIITKRDKNILFSDILPVKRCSEMFLADLEKRWQESALISTIADIVLKHASTTFSVYVKYCSNQIYQDRKLKQLKENSPRFLEVLTELESSPKCQSLAMHSFLMLPMQRITRLPLLLDAIFHRLERGSPHWHECNLALATLNKVVTECNEGARKMERMEEMLIISRQLDFREVRAVPLISASRWLVKKGELTRLIWRDLDAKLTFGKRISKHTLYFFLFTDLLVVTKRKSDDSYTVLDHCPRNMVQVLELDGSDKPPGRWLEGHKNLLIVTMLQNHENKTVEMVLSCGLESERTRWVEAVTPRTSDNPDEQIYEEWDCPQVQATHPYTSSQPDELSLEVSDVVNVLKKMADGWYQGERLRDGERGWFPGSYCKEIASAHVRARNLRQRYRLLTISGSMVEELRRNAENGGAEDRDGGAGGGSGGGGGSKTEKEEKKDRRKTASLKDVICSQGLK